MTGIPTTEFYAHTDTNLGTKQLLSAHLNQTADLAERYGQNAGLQKMCRLMGLAHDLGKFQLRFQMRLEDPKIDCPHSAAGASVLENIALKILKDAPITLSARALSVAKYLRVTAFLILCHHGGMRDVLTADGTSAYDLKLKECSAEANLDEIYRYGASEISAIALIAESDEFYAECVRIESYLKDAKTPRQPADPSNRTTEISRKCFFSSLIARYLFSVLVDADRTDTILFSSATPEKPAEAMPDWNAVCGKIDRKVKSFPQGRLSAIRNEIYAECALRALDPAGLFSLNVVTGGGKTLAGFRFAAGHAAQNGLARIFFVLPYISIIEQNAEVIRGVLGVDQASILSEIHSNFVREPEETGESQHLDLYTDSYANGVVFTTLVGFLESVYKGGTRGIRRFHNMARSILLFDEIQALPLKCSGFFNQLAEFLTGFLGSSVVLVSATEPCLDAVVGDRFRLPRPAQIIKKKYPEMRRVEYEIWKSDCKPLNSADSEKSTEEVVAKVFETLEQCDSVLVVVNTKDAARTLFASLRAECKNVYHLSTSMCAKHRSAVIRAVKQRLARGETTVLVSTQLIEAGVDLDFCAVFRSVAGIDNLVQAAGRCNREQKSASGKVVAFRYRAEDLSRLQDVRIRARVTADLLDLPQFQKSPDGDESIRAFFLKYYATNFAETPGFMSDGRELWTLSADNAEQAALARHVKNKFAYANFVQQFKTVGREFGVIDDGSVGVIVAYDGEARARIDEASKFPSRSVIKNLQSYTVNLRNYQVDKLIDLGLIVNVPNTELYEYIGAYDETGVTGNEAKTENEDILCL